MDNNPVVEAVRNQINELSKYYDFDEISDFDSNKMITVEYEVPDNTKKIRSKKKRHYKKWFNKHARPRAKVVNIPTINRVTLDISLKGDINNDTNN